ncbi:MAG: efflux RND transporter periplasmic adaptor subunit [Phycisphaerae bacterium]|nr:efflux RND transporter periplasmic adaptor subunit [Phycisphaerae bacterium]
MGNSDESRSAFSIVSRVAIGILFAIIVVALLLWLAGTFQPKIDTHTNVTSAGEDRATLPPGADLVAARTISVQREEPSVGTIRAVHETTLSSKLLAKVVEVSVKAGQRVSRGDILVRLDDADLRARLEQALASAGAARAARDQAKIEFDRVSELRERGAAAKIEWDRVDTDLKTAEANLARAEQAVAEAREILSYATIAAPITGVVIDKKVEAGDTVSPGQPLVTLFDPEHMQLVASVRESLTRRLSVGQTVNVEIDALDLRCQGRISEIVPEAESTSRTFSVKVTGPCPPGIYSGMFGRLLIPLGEEEVLVIPQAAVRRVGQLTTVDVADNGAKERRAVQLGRTFDQDVEVLSGLRPGEQVILPDADGSAS